MKVLKFIFSPIYPEVLLTVLKELFQEARSESANPAKVPIANLVRTPTLR